jgi:Leucine-rich repeat (LRR) protein
MHHNKKKKYVHDSKTEKVILSHTDIISVLSINHFTHLKVLNLSNNKITDMNDTLINLTTLTELNLSKNLLTKVNGLSYLKQLKKLNLSDNLIKNIPFMYNMLNLEKINLSDNNIECIENMHNLRNVKKLNLSYNKIVRLSNINGTSVFNDMNELRILSLVENNIFEINEKTFENLHELIDLNLSSNNLSNTNGLKNMKKLRILLLANNQIKNISDMIGLPNLQMLCIQTNMLEELNGLNNLVSLGTLHAYGNKIKKISGLDELKNLLDLDISENKIVEISGLHGLNKLTCLSLQFNEITEMKGINHLKKLEILDLSDNHIEVIENMDGLINLQHFNIQYNNINMIDESIVQCNKLKKFDYDNTFLISSNVQKFLIRKKILNPYQIYNDEQNVHDSTINKTANESVLELLKNGYHNRMKESINVFNDIINDDILTNETKCALFEYNEIPYIHSTYNLTFRELLVLVWTIINEKDRNVQNEIKKVMNIEINDAMCICFSGIMMRLLNSLRGFDERININTSINDNITQIVLHIKNKEKYLYYDSNDELKNKLINDIVSEMEERGYTEDQYNDWIQSL